MKPYAGIISQASKTHSLRGGNDTFHHAPHTHNINKTCYWLPHWSLYYLHFFNVHYQPLQNKIINGTKLNNLIHRNLINCRPVSILSAFSKIFKVLFCCSWLISFKVITYYMISNLVIGKTKFSVCTFQNFQGYNSGSGHLTQCSSSAKRIWLCRSTYFLWKSKALWN